MRRSSTFWLLAPLLFAALTTKAQTATIVSGNWNDATVWSNGLPGSPATVLHPTILNQNIAIGSGSYTFSENVTDISGGTNYTLSIGSGGVLDVAAGTTTFGGTAALNNFSSLYVRSGATLILGSTSIGNNVTILVEAGGTLIINGDLTSGNNTGTFTIGGLVYVNGNFNNGGTADVIGSGDIITTGSLNNGGSSTTFGSNEDCTTGPCSGQNLCGFTNSISANQTLCSGTSVSDLTGSTNAGAPVTYLWEYSTTSSTIGFSSAPGTNNAASYSPGTLTQTTWFRRKVTAGSGTGNGCTGTSPAVQITIVSSSAGGWIGVTSSDWNVGTNWCSGSVPTSTTDVTIPSGVTNNPQISTAASAHNITINSGATLTITGSPTLSLYGNLTNNGTFDPSNGTVSFTGSTDQTLTSGALTFNNIVFNNSAGIVFDALATVTNQITMTNGIVNLSSNNISLTNSTSTTALSYSSGWFYNGAFTRSLPGSTFSPSRLFPMGTSSDYRPFGAMRSGSGGSAGTLRVSHAGSSTTTDVSISDPSTSSTITRRQESSWSVSNTGLTNGTWTISAGGTGFGTVGSTSDLRVMRSSDVVGNHGTASGLPTNFSVTRTITSSQLTNTFYIGSINAAQTPLPIRLLNFSGYYTGYGIMIEWSTASEDNFDHFLLERSINGIDFEPMARITGEGGHNIKTNYSHLDESVSSGRFYYRLKSIDIDESYEYSKIISVTTSEENISLAVYPNPVNEPVFYVKANETSSAFRLVLFDELGKIHIDCSLNQGENEIPVTTLPNGVYIVRIAGSTSFKTTKLIIAR